MNIVFDDRLVKDSLYPFTATRNAADIRIGILTIREKWQQILNQNTALTEGIVMPLPANIIATTENALSIIDGVVTKNHSAIYKPWDIFLLNDAALRNDYKLITSNRTSQKISTTNRTIAAENIFIEAGAKVEHSILNASTGPIYIGKNAEVMEGCMVRGPFALCDNSVLKMGSKVYGATTIGPNCAVAGEIKNSILFANSNKAHDGYLGDSVIGEWCNLGAGTTNSNVKNTGGAVKAWSNSDNEFLPVGLKCGLLMGDYSRSAINTSFNTGTVVGVCCNIFGAGYPPKFVPDFTWGDEKYIFEKVLKDIGNWKNFKGQQITEAEEENLRKIYTQ
jgi:UDP-N-acetylglucosamine diphosphorylase/glucosamine-1-phosphate N-acetyltransferase